MPKQWWKSKTIQLNIVLCAIAIVQALQGQAWFLAEYQVAIAGILNIILRFITSQPIGPPPGGPGAGATTSP